MVEKGTSEPLVFLFPVEMLVPEQPMAGLWEVWRGVSAGIAVALVAILIVRHVFETRIGERLRRALDLLAGPMFVLFVLYIATDFYRGVP